MENTSSTIDIELVVIEKCDNCGKKFGKKEQKNRWLNTDKYFCNKCFNND